MSALFQHHRDLVPSDLEKRLLPMCVRQPEEPVTIKRNVFKKKRPQVVIYLPDLSHSLPPPPPRTNNKLLADRIIEEVCYQHNLTEKEFLSNSRNADLAHARQEAAYLIAEHTDMPIASMGRLMNRDHTTIMHSIMRYCERNYCDVPRGSAWKRRRVTK